MWAESGYIQKRGRMELGHRLEVAGATMVWRRESAYLVREPGRLFMEERCMLGEWGLRAQGVRRQREWQVEGAEAWNPEARNHSEN